MAGKIGRFQFDVQFPVAAVYCGRSTQKDFPVWRSLGPDLVEIRLDHFKPQPFPEYPRAIRELKTVLPCPFLLTIRSKKEGAGDLGALMDEPQRLVMFENLMDEVEGIDIELSAGILRKVLALARAKKRTTVLSIHDFKKTPPDSVMNGWLRKAKATKADIVKIACMANGAQDAIRLLSFAHKNRTAPLIVQPMGPAGRPFRILAPLFGSRWSYAYLDAPTAPGQHSLGEYREIASRL